MSMTMGGALQSLTLPEAYGIVEKNVFRSSSLQPQSYGLFKHIRTLLSLAPEAPTKSLQSFVDDNKINLVHLGFQQLVKPNASWRPVSEELIKEALELLLDATSHPILIMCTSGVHETGTLVGCLRKLQGWNFNSIVVE
eukprot:jgi/Hompol1/6811/HPOL_005104-RA